MIKKLIKFLLTALLILCLCYFLGFLLNCFVESNFKFKINTTLFFHKKTFLYLAAFALIIFLIWVLYYYKNYWILNSKNIMKGQERDKHFLANLEQARFQTKKELKRNYKCIKYKNLKNNEVIGIPIQAHEHNKKLSIIFSPPSHTLIIGTTGSGKTTAFVNPTIQILAETKAKPSMLISDPKGELYLLHAKTLEDKGYEVKVLDLRNPYNSIRWNPLERAFINYHRMIHLEDEVNTIEEKGFFEFDGKIYYDPIAKNTAIQVKKQQLYDEVYEDVHDIINVLCPIGNRNEPMWESGARNFVLAIALAILEDSENEQLGITKEKYNFFSIMKVATNTDNDCEDLINYFRNRNPFKANRALNYRKVSAPF